MPQDRYSSQGAFDVEILNPRALNAPDGLATALRTIEAICRLGDPAIARMVEALSSRSYILEYIISVLEEVAYAKFSKWIVTGFPTSAEPNTNAMSMQLLQRFSSSLLSMKYPSTVDVPPNLRAFRKKVELSFDILKNLEGNAYDALTGGNTSVSRKRSKSVTNTRHIDPLPFDSMGIAVPTTGAEVRDVYTKVLSQLRSVLESYLLILRKPILSQVLKSAYMKERLSSEGESNQSEDPAFSMVQPMKAALYFDDIEGFGEWSILLSTRAQKDLRELKRADGAIFRIVMKRVKQLSQGVFSSGNRKPLTAPEMKIPIYEAMVSGATRLIYHIDCIPDLKYSHGADSQFECQVIRIFGIFTLAQLHHGQFWNCLSRQLQRRGPDYIDRCTLPVNVDNDVILPIRFPPLSHQVEDVSQTVPLVKVSEEEMKDIHSMLVLDKFVTLSRALLNSIIADREVAHVFSVSGQEQEIIEHPSSCYVIGRSGTGKTTTMLFKMLGIQRIWQKYPDMAPKPRQLFITQSRVLASKVEEYFAKLMSSLEAAAYSPEELRMREKDVEQEDGLADQDDNQQWRSDLPERFSELRDEHFPLFITYDRLCAMLQKDSARGNYNDDFIIPETHVLGDEETSPTSPTSPRKSRLRAGSGVSSSSDHMQQSRKSFISYSVFLASYWDRLPGLTRSFDPALVFGEFMGVIEGSEDTVGTKHGYLDRESYKSLSVRSQATFSHTRDDIYELFTAYTRLKGQRGDYDAADRTHRILEDLRDVGLVGRKVDFLYVDEVQDNLLIDTLVLRTICANQHGLFWAGDTAQTISIGSSFRFADLKAYQYRIEKQLSYDLGLTPAEPRTFELVLNYRSHSGIVNCARSVIEFIIRYWPYSIDALQPEGATTEGCRPSFFVGQDDADLEKSFFGDNQGEPIEFGANQCVLVRNDAAKEKLQKRLGNSLILTLYESKGLEFNDVLLYNFFKDSSATLKQWRLMLNEVPNAKGLPNIPTFDKTRHASICIELKFLYVAITRARNNLWIVDSSDSAEPMKEYWMSRDEIEIRSSTAEAPRLAVASTSEEWAKTARTMFFNKRYAQASIAFQRAKRYREAKICDAYLMREKARIISTTLSAARTQAFIDTASAFISCALDCPSKQVDERIAYYGAAGECYSEARDLKNAGNSYLKAKKYGAAARNYREGGYFDEMVEVITQHGKAIESGLRERLKMAAQMHYFKRLETQTALKLFDSEDDALEFLDDYDLDEARFKLLMELGRVLKAAGIHAKKGNMVKAVEILITSAHRVDHVRPTIEYLLTGLRRSLTLGVLPVASPTASKLLAYVNRLEKSAMTEQEIDELAMFEAIQGNDHASLHTLAKTFIAMENDPAALLCLDHVFSSPLELRGLPLVEVQASLSLYFDYTRLLNKFRRGESLVQGSNHQTLFGFQALGGNRYLTPRHTILHEKLTGRSGSNKKSADGFKCGSEELRRGINQLVSSRLSDRTEPQNDACLEVHGFSPCLRSLFENGCDSLDGKGTCTLQHIQREQVTADWYNARLRLILLQIQILNSARYDDFDVKSYWLGILYSALHPCHPRLGSLANLDIDTIPDGADGLGIVREWARSVCYDSNGNFGSMDRFKQSFMAASTLAFDLDRENARRFIHRAPLYTSARMERSSIVQNFVTFLTAKAHHSLVSGLRYLRGILRSGMPVDLNALCDLAERLSGLLIMAYQAGLRGGLLHNVILPRSWFINLMLPDTDLRKDTSSFVPFASTMIEVMQRIDVQVRQCSTHVPDNEERSATPVPGTEERSTAPAPENNEKCATPVLNTEGQSIAPPPDTKEQSTAPTPDTKERTTAPAPKTKEQSTAPVPDTNEQPTAPIPDTKEQSTTPTPVTEEHSTVPAPYTKEQSTAPASDTKEQPTTPIPDTKEQSAVLTPETKEQSAMPAPDTKEQSATPIPNTKEQSTAPAPDGDGPADSQGPTPASDAEKQFIADGDELTDLTGPLYIARICLCLCLMGYNTNDDNFKRKILAGIQSLRRRDGKSTPWIYRRYANAEGWDDLVYTFTRSLKNSSLDEMVLLAHTVLPDPCEQRQKYVRLVFYRRLDDVPKLLTGALSALTSSATSTRQQRPRVEVATGARPDGDHKGQGHHQRIDDVLQEGVAEGKEAEVVTSSGDHEEEIDEALVNAAKVIQDAYRRHLKRMSVVRTGIDENQAHYWQLLRQMSTEMEWPKDSQYYLLFRVPLAYILVCLDAIKTFIDSEDDVGKKRLNTGAYQDIDDLMDALTKYRTLRKQTIMLQKKLSPSSRFHEKQSVSDLQRVVGEVKAVLESVYSIPASTGLKKQIQKSWDRGWQWISEKERSGAKGKKAEKPKAVLTP